LPAKRTITNRRYSTDADLCAALRLERVPADRQTVAYCRVSSQAQKPDLENQRSILEQYCQRQGIQVDEWIMEIGGGMNFKRKQSLRLIDQILAGESERVVLNKEQLSPEQELVQDLITSAHCFRSRLYGLRNDRKALEKAIQDDQGAQDQAAPDA
jgi:predicted site-specific integrase-resolvase